MRCDDGDVRRFAEFGGLCGPVAKVEGILQMNKEPEVGKVPVTVWENCYNDSWKSQIVDAAFAHP